MQAVCGARPLSIAIFQSACRDDAPAERLDRLEAAAARAEADLLIAPELYLSGYDVGDLIAARAEPIDGPSLIRMAEIARKTGIAIACGFPERDGDRLYNAALAVGPGGAMLARHRKLRLPNARERSLFACGADVTNFDLHGWRIGMVICFDIEFPEIVRRTTRSGAALIAAPTALTEHWGVVARRMVPTRALENGVYLAYANHAGAEGGSRYLGDSRIVGPDGDDIAVAGTGEELIRATLDAEAIAEARATLPYLDDSATLFVS